MDNFVVSARKYRPATFESVVGQSHITTTLKNAIKSKHLAQAFLFCGPRGVGKTTNARILAKTINCENITADVEACNVCDSCKSFNNNASFNVHELDAASNNSVDDIRSLVDQVRYPPQYGKYKIYIIDEVHMLSTAAFNAFLKTLEEPPSYAIFILATTEKHKIIPTILSRCQIFDFNRIQVKDIADHLAYIAKQENIKAEAQALHLIAQKADGALRDALSIFDLIVTFSSNNTVTYKTTIENLHILDYDYYFRMTDVFHKQDAPAALLIFDEILKQGFDGHNFIVGISEHFRNLLVCKDASTLKLLEVADDVKKKYSEQAQQCSVSFLMSCLNIANTCDLQYKSSRNQRLHVELALMKMAYLNSAINLSKLNPEELKKKPETPIKETEKTVAFKKEQAFSIKDLSPKEKENAVPKSESKSSMKLPKLDTLKQEVRDDSKKQEDKKESTQSYGNKQFSLEDVKKYWNSFALNLKNESKKSEFIIMDREITLDKNTIKVKLDNLIQADQLDSIKTDLLEFLRKKLDNNNLILESDVSESEGKRKIYTSDEKFKYLSEKYPFLDDMKKRFGLETDF
ncbi:MAG TPA: DNA polymerase III subunit gamma/tau [Cytophagaceae bacterium]|nr:DNA polymerase III subunit gamma/tau [Cytophagaceae bacterium]